MPSTICDSRSATRAASVSPKRGGGAQRPFTALFRPLPAVKRGTREAAIWMRSPVRGLTPIARAALADVELAESRHRHLAAATQRILDRGEHRVHGARGVLLGQIGAVGHLVDQLGLRHFALLVRETVGVEANTACGRGDHRPRMTRWPSNASPGS